jgi:glycosyltransferase involved in cell wall biosynthesis
VVEISCTTQSARAPRVSVIIPTYNRAADVSRCLDSLMTQTFRDFEVLVCDDGSVDMTAEVVDRYKKAMRLSYHWADNFGGPARPRNTGLRLARGAYIAFLDSDDWWTPRKLARSVRRLDAGADLVYHDMYLAQSSRQRFYWRRCHTRILTPPVFEDLLRNGNAVCTSSVVLRRDILLRVGGFSEDRSLIACEDFDAWLRIAKITERFERLDETLGYYWHGSGNISSPQRLVVNLERFRELYGTPEQRSSESDLPGWYHYSLGRAHYRLNAPQQALRHLRFAIRGRLPLLEKVKALITFAGALARRYTQA